MCFHPFRQSLPTLRKNSFIRRHDTCNIGISQTTDMGLPKIRQNMACFLYAPLTSCEIERFYSLSEAKYINSAKISRETAKIDAFEGWKLKVLIFVLTFFAFLFDL